MTQTYGYSSIAIAESGRMAANSGRGMLFGWRVVVRAVVVESGEEPERVLVRRDIMLIAV